MVKVCAKVLSMEDHTQPATIKRGPPSATNGRTSEPHFEVVTITPDLATEWLEHNTHNRPVKWSRVKQWAGAMKRGEWKLNGDAIRFDYNGVLIDGQNRLWAIVEADRPIASLVATNLEPDAQDTMDLGVRRSLADTLALRGEANTITLASLTNWLWRWEQFEYGLVPDMDHRYSPTIAQALNFFDANRTQIVEAVKNGNRTRQKVVGAHQLSLCACWYRFHAINWEDCEDFFYKFGLGASLEEDNPIFRLRKFCENHAKRATGQRKPRGEIYIAVTVKAWNAYRAGQRIEALNFRAGGAKPEKFPVPQ